MIFKISEIKKAEKPVVRVERTKIEYPKNQSRIEIVRRAPQKPVKKEGEKSDRPERGERKPFNKGGQEKKLVERRIIPQEIYEGKSNTAGGKKKVDRCGQGRAGALGAGGDTQCPFPALYESGAGNSGGGAGRSLQADRAGAAL